MSIYKLLKKFKEIDIEDLKKLDISESIMQIDFHTPFFNYLFDITEIGENLSIICIKYTGQTISTDAVYSIYEVKNPIKAKTYYESVYSFHRLAFFFDGMLLIEEKGIPNGTCFIDIDRAQMVMETWKGGSWNTIEELYSKLS